MVNYSKEIRSELLDNFERFGLRQQADAVIIKQAKKMCLVPGTIGEAFVFHTWNTIIGIIEERKAQSDGSLTDSQYKALLVDWIKTEKVKAKKMYKGQNSNFSGYVD